MPDLRVRCHRPGTAHPGEVAEWSNAADSKSASRAFLARSSFFFERRKAARVSRHRARNEVANASYRWTSSQSSGLGRTYTSVPVRILLYLQLLTAQRKGKLVSATWPEMDFGSAWWMFPDASKSGLAHRGSLTKAVRALFASLPRVTGNPQVFAARPGTLALSQSDTDNALGHHRTQTGVADFTPHNLRRIAATQMASLGVPRLVTGKILNHAEVCVTANHDRHDREKAEALTRWAQHLLAHINRSSKLSAEAPRLLRGATSGTGAFTD